MVRVAAQKVVIDWALIDGIKAAQDFASQLAEAQRSFADRTSISGGIDFAMARLQRAPFQSSRRTIDVSGDGTNNSGRDVAAARDEAVAQGVTINGLVILTPSSRYRGTLSTPIRRADSKPTIAAMSSPAQTRS